jgi:hypothetical protein
MSLRSFIVYQYITSAKKKQIKRVAFYADTPASVRIFYELLNEVDDRLGQLLQTAGTARDDGEIYSERTQGVKEQLAALGL